MHIRVGTDVIGNLMVLWRELDGILPFYPLFSSTLFSSLSVKTMFLLSNIMASILQGGERNKTEYGGWYLQWFPLSIIPSYFLGSHHVWIPWDVAMYSCKKSWEAKTVITVREKGEEILEGRCLCRPDI